MINPFQRLPLQQPTPPPTVIIPSTVVAGINESVASRTAADPSNTNDDSFGKPDGDGESTRMVQPSSIMFDIPALSLGNEAILMSYDKEADDDEDWETATEEEDDTYIDDDSDESDDDSTISNRSAQIRPTRKYMPEKDSALYTYLNGMKHNILNDGKGKYTNDGAHWVPPSMDPISKGRTRCENWSTLSETWIYVWLHGAGTENVCILPIILQEYGKKLWWD